MSDEAFCCHTCERDITTYSMFCICGPSGHAVTLGGERPRYWIPR